MTMTTAIKAKKTRKTNGAARTAAGDTFETDLEVETAGRTTAAHSMDLYLEEIGRYDLLTREEEIELADRIQAGDERAREKMITANLRLVVRIAQDFSGMGVPLEDMVQAGNVGLMTAAERFDPSFGARFSTYAACWIKQKIRRTLEIGRMVRLPTHVHEKLRAIRKVQNDVLQETGFDATYDQIAEETGIPAKKVQGYLTASQHVAALDAPLEGLNGDGDGPKLGDTVSGTTDACPSEDLEKREIHNHLHEALPMLDQRERKILRCRFGLGGEAELTLEEVGRVFGISRERVRQIQNVALEKLRHALQRKEVPDDAEQTNLLSEILQLRASAA